MGCRGHRDCTRPAKSATALRNNSGLALQIMRGADGPLFSWPTAEMSRLKQSCLWPSRKVYYLQVQILHLQENV